MVTKLIVYVKKVMNVPIMNNILLLILSLKYPHIYAPKAEPNPMKIKFIIR